MSDRSSPKGCSPKEESPKIDKKVKNFSALLKARAKAEAKNEQQLNQSSGFIPLSASGSPAPVPLPRQGTSSRPASSASTVRPDSVLSFRSEIPNVNPNDVGVFRPESTSLLPPDTVNTIRPDSVAAHSGAGQSVFRPFQAPSGPTARFNIQYQPSSDADWEAKDEMRQRELEEMRARAAQMEKTMRWWSDCTANWREKWSKVRNERNKTREDCRQLRSKLEVVVKECTGLKREKQDLITEVDKLRAENELNSIRDPDKDSDSMSTGSNLSIKSQPDIDSLAAGNDSDDKSNTRHLSAGIAEAKLRELTKIYNAEKDEKETMRSTIDELRMEISSLKSELSDMSSSNGKLRERLDLLMNTQTSAKHKTNDSNADSADKSQMMIEQLRCQLEKMQVENAAEWAKREQISSEKHSLERENKKLKSIVEELQDEMRKRHTGLSTAKDQDINTLQSELTARTKEFTDLRQGYSKQKKQLQESNTELAHSTRRADQYEQEVKKLRARIEELKDDLITAENEIDTHSNMVRKLQRTCDDLQETNENYQSQTAHLQSRLRSTGLSVSDLSADLSTPLSGELSSDDDEEDETEVRHI